jgi:hypothetical protein
MSGFSGSVIVILCGGGSIRPSLKGIPEWFVGQVFFGGLGHRGQKNMIFLNIYGLLALVPQASNKDHLAKKTLRDPFHLGGPG